jgi:hypothetical protein
MEATGSVYKASEDNDDEEDKGEYHAFYAGELMNDDEAIGEYEYEAADHVEEDDEMNDANYIDIGDGNANTYVEIGDGIEGSDVVSPTQFESVGITAADKLYEAELDSKQ